MEENKKDACCADGKCACGMCHKKWVKILMAIVIALVIFLLGVSAGARFNRERRSVYYDGQSFGTAQCGVTGAACPMMRGGARRGNFVGNEAIQRDAAEIQAGAPAVDATPGTPAPVATSSTVK